MELGSEACVHGVAPALSSGACAELEEMADLVLGWHNSSSFFLYS